MVIIAVTGKKGSGKDTFADYLKEHYGFSKLDFSTNAINPVLEERGLEITRDNQIKVAMELRKEKGNGFFAEVLCKNIDPSKNSCISGMRFPEELEVMKKAFGNDLKLVSIICSLVLRHERIVKRGDKGEGAISFEDFKKSDEKPTEKAIDGIISLADYFIDNNGSIDDLNKNIEVFSKEIGL